MVEQRFCVMRQDDNGNQYVVETGLSEPEAQRVAASYTERAHKQLYWVEPAQAHTAVGRVPR